MCTSLTQVTVESSKFPLWGAPRPSTSLGPIRRSKCWAWVDLNHRPRPYQGLLCCDMHNSMAMITLVKTSLMVTSWHDCWFQAARSVQSGDHFLQADLPRLAGTQCSGRLFCDRLSSLPTEFVLPGT